MCKNEFTCHPPTSLGAYGLHLYGSSGISPISPTKTGIGSKLEMGMGENSTKISFNSLKTWSFAGPGAPKS